MTERHTGSQHAARQLHAALQQPLRQVADAVHTARLALAALNAAARDMDVSETMAAAAGVTLACEALTESAKQAESSSRHALAETMQQTGATRLQLAHHTASLRSSTRYAVVTDPDQIPDAYVLRRQPILDKPAIRRDLIAGETIPGAYLSNGGSLTVTFRARESLPPEAPEPAA